MFRLSYLLECWKYATLVVKSKYEYDMATEQCFSLIQILRNFDADASDFSDTHYFRTHTVTDRKSRVRTALAFGGRDQMHFQLIVLGELETMWNVKYVNEVTVTQWRDNNVVELKTWYCEWKSVIQSHGNMFLYKKFSYSERLQRKVWNFREK